MSLVLLNIVLEVAIKTISVNLNDTVDNKLVHVMTYAEDIAISSRIEGALQWVTQELVQGSESLAFEIKVCKDK